MFLKRKKEAHTPDVGSLPLGNLNKDSKEEGVYTPRGSKAGKKTFRPPKEKNQRVLAKPGKKAKPGSYVDAGTSSSVSDLVPISFYTGGTVFFLLLFCAERT
jgi:hypothetical protein